MLWVCATFVAFLTVQFCYFLYHILLNYLTTNFIPFCQLLKVEALATRGQPNYLD